MDGWRDLLVGICVSVLEGNSERQNRFINKGNNFRIRISIRANFHLKHDELHSAAPQKEPALPVQLGQL